VVTDLLEREIQPCQTDVTPLDDRRLRLALRPFQILTLRLRPQTDR
jgi:alpha-mannosidase